MKKVLENWLGIEVKMRLLTTIGINPRIEVVTNNVIPNDKFENIKIKVFRHAWVPGTKYIWRYTRLFNAMCWIYSVLSRKGKQIFVEAQKT